MPIGKFSPIESILYSPDKGSDGGNKSSPSNTPQNKQPQNPGIVTGPSSIAPKPPSVIKGASSTLGGSGTLGVTNKYDFYSFENIQLIYNSIQDSYFEATNDGRIPSFTKIENPEATAIQMEKLINLSYDKYKKVYDTVLTKVQGDLDKIKEMDSSIRNRFDNLINKNNKSVAGNNLRNLHDFIEFKKKNPKNGADFDSLFTLDIFCDELRSIFKDIQIIVNESIKLINESTSLNQSSKDFQIRRLHAFQVTFRTIIEDQIPPRLVINPTDKLEFTRDTLNDFERMKLNSYLGAILKNSSEHANDILDILKLLEHKRHSDGPNDQEYLASIAKAKDNLKILLHKLVSKMRDKEIPWSIKEKYEYLFNRQQSVTVDEIRKKLVNDLDDLKYITQIVSALIQGGDLSKIVDFNPNPLQNTDPNGKLTQTIYSGSILSSPIGLSIKILVNPEAFSYEDSYGRQQSSQPRIMFEIVDPNRPKAQANKDKTSVRIDFDGQATLDIDTFAALLVDSKNPQNKFAYHFDIENEWVSNNEGITVPRMPVLVSQDDSSYISFKNIAEIFKDRLNSII